MYDYWGSHTYWSRKRVAQRSYSVNLSLLLECFTLYWRGIRGLQWFQLYFHLSRMYQVWPPPSILVIHLGGNDLGNIRTLDLLFGIKQNLHRFKLRSPYTVIVFSEILPRLSWFSSLQQKVMQKMRKRINRAMAKYMPLIGGLSYRHVDFEGGIQGFYRQNGV